ITAVDPDSGENGRLTYEFCEPNQVAGTNVGVTDIPVSDIFRISPEKGDLSLLFSPDREKTAEYRFTICVHDHGEPSETVMTNVLVTIRDVNDCQPQFEHSSYEYFVQVDRSGKVAFVNDQPAVMSRDHAPSAKLILLGHLAITDADASPNAGPFVCKLSSSNSAWSSHPSTAQADGIPDPSQKFVLTFQSSSNSSISPEPVIFHNFLPHQTGFCLLFAPSTLPLGSQSLVVRAHDSGLTALRTSVPVTVHVVRQSDLPPAIVSSNTTLTFYRGPLTYWARRSQMGKPSAPLTRITVKDRTAYDRLLFELLPNDSPAAANFFHIDAYDGTVRIRAASANSVNQSKASQRGLKNPELALLEPQLVFFSPLVKLESGTYPLRVRVTNNSLSAEGTITIKVCSFCMHSCFGSSTGSESGFNIPGESLLYS
ncbi:unnamed protein product, partial [Dibothriocephalus latus]